MKTLTQTVTEKEVSTVFSDQYKEIIEDLTKEQLNYQEILEKMKTYPCFSIKTLIFCANGLELNQLVKELEKANTCLCVLDADSSSSINLPSTLSNFGEEDFDFLVQKASIKGNELLTRALQHTQMMARASRVSRYRRLFASNKNEAYDYLDSLSIITLVNLAEDLAISLGNALYKESGSFNTEYALVAAKIHDSVQTKTVETSNVGYNAFFEKKMSKYTASAV